MRSQIKIGEIELEYEREMEEKLDLLKRNGAYFTTSYVGESFPFLIQIFDKGKNEIGRIKAIPSRDRVGVDSAPYKIIETELRISSSTK